MIIKKQIFRTNKLVVLLLLLAGACVCFSLPFRKPITSTAPDYSNLYYWAAHPYKHDPSDSIPAFLKDEKRDTSVDVFFLHPTTFISDMLGAPMNADVNDADLNRLTDMRTILMQASIFNGSARVFAPRYRQAHLKAYFRIRGEKSEQAFDLAYSDLRNAFQYYLDHWNKGRPIIIAGHSQGSMHAIRLLREFFDGKPLQKQLVCAYIPGWQIKKGDLKNIPLGTSPEQTHCVLGWRTYANGKSESRITRDTASLCVNPISWTTDAQWTTPAMHKGAVGKNFNVLLPHRVTAAIDPDDHILWVDGTGEIASDNDPVFNRMIKLGNLHVADFNLFYMDVRENVKQRVKNYWKNLSNAKN